MREIGVRELKRSLSETLRAAGRGEQIRVTVRGRAVADSVPARAPAENDQLRDLVAEGRVIPPARTRPPRAPRLVKSRASALHVAAALLLPRGELVFATWDRRQHAAAGAEGLRLMPDRID